MLRDDALAGSFSESMREVVIMYKEYSLQDRLFPVAGPCGLIYQLERSRFQHRTDSLADDNAVFMVRAIWLLPGALAPAPAPADDWLARAELSPFDQRTCAGSHTDSVVCAFFLVQPLCEECQRTREDLGQTYYDLISNPPDFPNSQEYGQWLLHLLGSVTALYDGWLDHVSKEHRLLTHLFRVMMLCATAVADWGAWGAARIKRLGSVCQALELKGD